MECRALFSQHPAIRLDGEFYTKMQRPHNLNKKYKTNHNESIRSKTNVVCNMSSRRHDTSLLVSSPENWE